MYNTKNVHQISTSVSLNEQIINNDSDDEQERVKHFLEFYYLIYFNIYLFFEI